MWFSRWARRGWLVVVHHQANRNGHWKEVTEVAEEVEEEVTEPIEIKAKSSRGKSKTSKKEEIKDPSKKKLATGT